MAEEKVVSYKEFMQHQERDKLWILLHGKGASWLSSREESSKALG